MNQMIDRVPPHNNEAEQSVIGAIFLEPQALITAAELLMPEDFYRMAHQKIFNTMIILSDKGQAIDVVTVTEELSAKKELEDVGGISYLTEIANSVPTAANIVHYARIVEEKALLRRLIRVATSIVEDGYAREDEVEALLIRSRKENDGSFQPEKCRGLSVILKMSLLKRMTISNFFIRKKATLQVSQQVSVI